VFGSAAEEWGEKSVETRHMIYIATRDDIAEMLARENAPLGGIMKIKLVP
jgi:hypothetical protein